MLSGWYLWHKSPGFKSVFVEDITGRFNHGLKNRNSKNALNKKALTFFVQAISDTSFSHFYLASSKW